MIENLLFFKMNKNLSTYNFNEGSDDEESNDIVEIQLISDSIQINYYQLLKWSKLVREQYPKDDIDRLSYDLRGYQQKYDLKEENIKSFFKCISDEQIQIAMDQYSDYQKLSKIFKVSKFDRIIKKYTQKYQNDVDFVIKIIRDQIYTQNSNIDDADVYCQISPDMEELLSKNIDKCFSNPIFNEFPASKVYRICEKSDTQISSDLLYDFIKKSVDERYILFRFLSIKNLSTEKFNDLCDRLLNNENSLSKRYFHYIPFDLLYLKEISDEKNKLKDKVGELNIKIEQNKNDKDGLEKEIEILKSDIIRLSSENDKLKSEKVILSSENDKLKSEKTRLSSENEKLKNDKVNLKNEKEESTIENKEMSNVKLNLSSKNKQPINDKPNAIISKSVMKCDPSKKVINLAVIGHVDSGKSTTIGHLLCQLQCINKSIYKQAENAAEKTGKSSYKYAFIMDKLQCERERGISIEVSEALFETSHHYFTVIDTPGCPDYNYNMITRITQATAAILMIDATSGGFEAGISEQGQTREYALIARSFGINQIVVAVNKMDHRTVNFSQNRFNEIKSEVTRVLTNIGFKPDEYKFVPISGFNGDNLIEKSSNLPWWNGGTLLDVLKTFDESKNLLNVKPLRFPILRVLDIPGVGTVVTGSACSGTLKPGVEVSFPLSNIKTKVKSIEMFHKKIDKADPNHLVGVCIDAPASKIVNGDVFGQMNIDPPTECVSFIAQIIIHNHPGKIRAGYEPILHCCTAHVPCKFEKLIQRIDLRHGKKVTENPEWIQKDDAAVVVMKPMKPIVVEAFKEYRRLGQFIIRDSRQTVAAGVIRSVEKKHQ